ncbi:MAG: transcription termination factor Rho [Microthrixaceae bacterium]|nr:transcription termination factor Rho [Microthrixaceae bacterium]
MRTSEVSADSIDRRGLERKDRNELATIVQTLGGKPNSRARKAELIETILQLAGVGGSSSDDSAESSTPAPPAPAPSAPEEVTDSVETETPKSASPKSSAKSDPQADARENPADTPDRQPTGGAQPKARGESANDRDSGSSSADETAVKQSDEGGPEGGADNGSDGNGDANGGEGESRNRRRRRGRNRDRAEEGDGAQWDGEPISVAGTLDLRDEGYGFLRVNGVLPSRDDVYVSVKQTRQFGLRRGDWLTGSSRPANRSEKNPALLRIDTVNGRDPETARGRARFEDLVPLFPDEQLRLERGDHPYDLTSRIIDLLAPIGKGQRGLIVAPPKSGKTTVMKTIAQAIEDNHPEVELIVLLVDERPEEVTDMRRSISGEVVASTFDRPPEEHIQVVELVVERAKRMVEEGQDVVILVDGITRLSRAYNLAAPAGGRIMSGGLDTGALYPPKRFFGAARNVEDGGSLTILATALVDTNSKMDEIIFEEFKGTGNMELKLDRDAAERRVYPAIDVSGSSTRHEELLIDPVRLQQVWKLRRLLAALSTDGEEGAALDLVLDRMRKFPTNESFLDEIAKSPAIR